MTNGKGSQNEGDTSSEKQQNTDIFNTGINPELFYPLEKACKLAGIGVKHMETIKRKYKNQGIHVWGHDVGCFGKDLIMIFIKESELSNE